jgi:hypothetical protein
MNSSTKSNEAKPPWINKSSRSFQNQSYHGIFLLKRSEIKHSPECSLAEVMMKEESAQEDIT